MKRNASGPFKDSTFTALWRRWVGLKPRQRVPPLLSQRISSSYQGWSSHQPLPRAGPEERHRNSNSNNNRWRRDKPSSLSSSSSAERQPGTTTDGVAEEVRPDKTYLKFLYISLKLLKPVFHFGLRVPV